MLSLSPISSASSWALSSPSTSSAPDRASRAVQRALDFIDACFADPISLSELAAVAGLSISRFAVRFSAEIGVSPQQYVRLVRVRHAQRLLRRGLPPSIVATEVGFFDQSHLCRHFKRVLGRTPGEWLSASG
ncbi:helix-turn-helix domain protein [Paraburkholderia xenovorans LB400]|uniref:Transcriptional regulator, AraC family n=1 Tax=Paraburkholderia xenovorans (strain LB400) TaxID=266265 RepID=Q13H38_PARXL|nr:AraC family transcriptional regulator [Paraburkholderia xenovorans]ABE36601.1 transcriptional regulator, AraC family [Paraburkholderia xenovorans LB400]AIP34598.1 helix-turn-helix domain protein [Paraburkholderia xenovorans LB400]